MELVAILGVPWEHWAALAAGAWVFGFVCFVGATAPRPRSRAGRPSNVVAFKPAAGSAGDAGTEQRQRVA
jgi:hypothetical protein